MIYVFQYFSLTHPVYASFIDELTTPVNSYQCSRHDRLEFLSATRKPTVYRRVGSINSILLLNRYLATNDLETIRSSRCGFSSKAARPHSRSVQYLALASTAGTRSLLDQWRSQEFVVGVHSVGPTVVCHLVVVVGLMLRGPGQFVI